MRSVPLIVLLLFSASPALSQTLTVSPDGPITRLTDALADATPGATILLKAGFYQEPPIVVTQAVTIQGEEGAVLDGASEHQILTIQADSVTVRGLTFQNVGTSFVEDRAALKVDEGHHCTIEHNRFEDTFFAIYLAKSAHCRIAHNTIIGTKATESRSANGIHLWYSRYVTIAHNTIRGHRDGIYLEFVEDSEVLDNVSENNMRYGLHFMFSDRCNYRRNLLRSNDAGVAVMYTKHVEMTANRFEDNWGSAAYGLLLKDITDSRIADNLFLRNTIGIHAEGSNRMVVTNNTFRENGWALKLMANSEDNTFSGNAFLANTFDVATNSRKNYSTFSQNYWDSYQGYDLNRDGYGDVPYRPVRLFSLIVEHNEPALILMRSLFVDLLDVAERVVPALTPETLIDNQPLMTQPL